MHCEYGQRTTLISSADLLKGLAGLVRVASEAEDGCSVEQHDRPGTAQVVWELVHLGTWTQGMEYDSTEYGVQ